jgi:hypothetical protein
LSDIRGGVITLKTLVEISAILWEEVNNKGFKCKYEGLIVRNGKNYDVIQHYKNGTEVTGRRLNCGRKQWKQGPTSFDYG